MCKMVEVYGTYRDPEGYKRCGFCGERQGFPDTP